MTQTLNEIPGAQYFVLSDLPERPHGFSMHLKYKFLKALYLNTNL